MLSRFVPTERVRGIFTRVNTAFQALRYVSYALYTSARDQVLLRLIHYFFSRDNADNTTGISSSPTPTQQMMKTAAVVAAKNTAAAVSSPLKQENAFSALNSAVIKRALLQKSPLSSVLFYHPASKPANLRGSFESKVAKLT